MNRPLLVLALIASLSGCSKPGEAPSADLPEEDQAAEPVENARIARADPRIADLLFPCARQEYFGEDTSELIPALLQKLETGHKDPLLRAQLALAARGEDALPGLNALTDRLLTSPEYFQRLHNVLGVVARMEPPIGKDLALRLVEAPNETLRLSALQAMERRAGPEEYDQLAASLPGSSGVLGGVIVQVLARADASRLANDLASWIRDDVRQLVWDPAAAALNDFPPDSPDGEILCEALVDIKGQVGLPLRARLLALCVTSGSPASAGIALEELRQRAESKDPTERGIAFDGLRIAGRSDLLIPLITGEKEVRLRQFALAAVQDWEAGASPDPQVVQARIEVLKRSLRDEDDGVRRVASMALVAEADREAIDLALIALNGPREELEDAVASLAPLALEDPAIADAAVEVLSQRVDGPEIGRDLRMVAQALGRIPSEAAARILMDRARSEIGLVASMRAHRFLTLQIANTQEFGVPVLIEALAQATDPLERLDLLEALSTSDTDAATTELVSILEEGTERSGELADLEALYVSNRLLLTRPATLVAPLLKRTALRMEVGDVRLAMQCLLWRYFGPED